MANFPKGTILRGKCVFISTEIIHMSKIKFKTVKKIHHQLLMLSETSSVCWYRNAAQRWKKYRILGT